MSKCKSSSFTTKDSFLLQVQKQPFKRLVVTAVKSHSFSLPSTFGALRSLSLAHFALLLRYQSYFLAFLYKGDSAFFVSKTSVQPKS
jgi:hypothetical protein